MDSQEILKVMVESLLGDDRFEIEKTTSEEGFVQYNVKVDKDEFGRVVGKKGRNASAVRTIVKAAEARNGNKARVDFIER